MKSIFILLIVLPVHFLYAQEVQYEINSASSSVKTDCFRVTWSLGGINYEEYDNGEIAFSNNWLYYEIADDLSDIDSDKLMNIYPNPVSEVLNIKTLGECQLPIEVNIYNINGGHIIQESITRIEDIIDVSFLSQGFYILKFVNKNGQIEIFKIIKN